MSRDAEDPAVIRDRWDASMLEARRLSVPPRGRSEDSAAKAARDAANQKGANAWSPSRAREALRERVSRAVRSLEAEGCYTSAREWLKVLRIADQRDAFADRSTFAE